MARLESILFTPMRANILSKKVDWTHVAGGRAILGLPQIFWSDGKPWREANLWLMDRATSRDTHIKTVQSNATALRDYAEWLEQERVAWWQFPILKKDRCLVKYRGAVIDARDSNRIKPSTASQRMRVAVQFYRWLEGVGLLTPQSPLWRERTVAISQFDRMGFERTLFVRSTDLAIPNRRIQGTRLEDGVFPVSIATRNGLLNFAEANASREVFLMLLIGFFTGMRLGSICDLKVQTLLNAESDLSMPALRRLAIGPGATPPVSTKYGVTGFVYIPQELLEALLSYAFSVQRLGRKSNATDANRDLLFLTRFSNGYAERGINKSVALNVEMNRLRKIAERSGVHALKGFKFHQTRATYATELARIAISKIGPINAISFVKDALLHRDEQTSLKYIKFAETQPIKEALSNEFSELFLGLFERI